MTLIPSVLICSVVSIWSFQTATLSAEILSRNSTDLHKLMDCLEIDGFRGKSLKSPITWCPGSCCGFAGPRASRHFESTRGAHRNRRASSTSGYALRIERTDHVAGGYQQGADPTIFEKLRQENARLRANFKRSQIQLESKKQELLSVEKELRRMFWFRNLLLLLVIVLMAKALGPGLTGALRQALEGVLSTFSAHRRPRERAKASRLSSRRKSVQKFYGSRNSDTLQKLGLQKLDVYAGGEGHRWKEGLTKEVSSVLTERASAGKTNKTEIGIFLADFWIPVLATFIRDTNTEEVNWLREKSEQSLPSGWGLEIFEGPPVNGPVLRYEKDLELCLGNGTRIENVLCPGFVLLDSDGQEVCSRGAVVWTS